MPLEPRDRLLAPELALPPPFTLVRLRELGDAFAYAKSIAAEQGAGTLLVFVVHVAAERLIVGLGFVVVPEAQTDAEKVMTAVQSVKGTP